MAKLFLAFKSGKLLATPLQLPKPSYTSIHLGWSDLICQEGLIIPQNAGSAINAKRFFDRKTTMIPGQTMVLQGLLVQLDGDLLSFELLMSSQASSMSQLPLGSAEPMDVVADESTSIYLPTSTEAIWARSGDPSHEEAIYAALHLGKTPAEAQDIIVRSGIDVAKFYQWYDYTELVKLARTLHAKHYPNHPLYTKTPAATGK